MPEIKDKIPPPNPFLNKPQVEEEKKDANPFKDKPPGINFMNQNDPPSFVSNTSA